MEDNKNKQLEEEMQSVLTETINKTGISKLLEQQFKDQILGLWCYETVTIENLIERYSNLLTKDELENIKLYSNKNV